MTQDDNTSPAEPPRYVERVPAGQRTSPPKPAENAATPASAETADSAASIKTGKASGPTEAKELGGPKGPEPTRFGDWERDGRCVDF